MGSRAIPNPRHLHTRQDAGQHLLASAAQHQHDKFSVRTAHSAIDQMHGRTCTKLATRLSSASWLHLTVLRTQAIRPCGDQQGGELRHNRSCHPATEHMALGPYDAQSCKWRYQVDLEGVPVPWQLPHRVLPVPPHRLQGLAANWRANGGPRDVTMRLSGCASCDSSALTFQLPMQAAPASAAVPIISRFIQALPPCTGMHDREWLQLCCS